MIDMPPIVLNVCCGVSFIMPAFLPSGNPVSSLTGAMDFVGIKKREESYFI